MNLRLLFDSIHKDSPFQSLENQGISLNPSESFLRPRSTLKTSARQMTDRRKTGLNRIGRPDRDPMAGWGSRRKPEEPPDPSSGILLPSDICPHRLSQSPEAPTPLSCSQRFRFPGSGDWPWPGET